MQARGGINVPPPEFLPLLRRLCDEHKALLIVDEIYTGFGRTGQWFACEHSQTIPDLICLGKALTGGFPLSACVGRADIMDLAWPESRGETRSDTHAWSAHPTADLLAIVAGIQPAAPGYARLRVAPVLGDLTSLDAAAATPKGAVSVRYDISGGKLMADITRPADLPGDFVWKGKSYPLTKSVSHFVLAP